jgi:hypothetical protein
MTYKLTHENWILRISDGARIPTTDPSDNEDCVEYLIWLADGGIPEPADPPTEAEQRDRFKVERASSVASITVTTAAGNTFDGDEISQGRMARAILALPDGKTVRWVLHDNTEIDATSVELREALALAGAEQARLWVKTE